MDAWIIRSCLTKARLINNTKEFQVLIVPVKRLRKKDSTKITDITKRPTGEQTGVNSKDQICFLSLSFFSFANYRWRQNEMTPDLKVVDCRTHLSNKKKVLRFFAERLCCIIASKAGYFPGKDPCVLRRDGLHGYPLCRSAAFPGLRGNKPSGCHRSVFAKSPQNSRIRLPTARVVAFDLP